MRRFSVFSLEKFNWVVVINVKMFGLGVIFENRYLNREYFVYKFFVWIFIDLLVMFFLKM